MGTADLGRVLVVEDNHLNYELVRFISPRQPRDTTEHFLQHLHTGGTA